MRCDHALAEGDEQGGAFDPLLAKLIAWGEDRDVARRRLIAGLEGLELLGLRSNRGFLARVLAHPAFAAGPTTGFLTRDFAGDASLTPQTPDPALLALAVLVLAGGPGLRFGFATGPAPVLTRRFDTGHGVADVTLTLRGATADLQDGRRVALEELACGHAVARIDGVLRRIPCARAGDTLHLGDLILIDVTLSPPDKHGGTSDGRVTAPMAGGVVSVLVAPGDRVAPGQVLAVIEAMKMEHPLRAPIGGRIASVGAAMGAQVRARQVLFEIEGDTE
jgi:geranyl-CoA carboxylase alpha subunit